MKCALTSQICVVGKFNAFRFILHIISKTTEHKRPHLWHVCWIQLDASFQSDSEPSGIYSSGTVIQSVLHCRSYFFTFPMRIS